nr:MAG: hypothetical protein [Wufeng shrew picorna-like virus 26]
MAAAAAALLGGTTLSGAFNLGGQALQNSGNLNAVNSQNDFNRWAIQNREKAFTDLGLPSAYAYMGQTPQIPQTISRLSGYNWGRTGINGNFISGKDTTMRQKMGFYGPINGTSSGVIPNDNFPGQNDRLGLGNGRYSAVPPPIIDYNSRGTQTNPTFRTRIFRNSAM